MLYCLQLVCMRSKLEACKWSQPANCMHQIHADQEVVRLQPIMLFNPGKMTSTSRILFEQNIAMTIVGFPATALLSARARVCISASHTRADLDWALQVTPQLLFILCRRRELHTCVTTYASHAEQAYTQALLLMMHII